MQQILVTELGDPSVLKIQQTPIPSPTPTQVLVKIYAVGVNPVEAYIRNGTLPGKLPWVPGSDGAGVIESVGDEVKDWKKGDRVYIALSLAGGTYSQYLVCDANNVHPLPERVSFDQGAALFVPYATAYQALFQVGEVKPSDTVLIHGASGGVGIACVQFARAFGNTVIGTAGTPEGEAVVKKQGAHFVLNHRKEGYLKEIEKITDGKGVNVVLEMVANVNLQKDAEVLSARGRIVVIGNKGQINFNPSALMMKRSEVRGMALPVSTEEEMKDILAGMNAGLENGTINPVIMKSFALKDAPKAHEEILNPPKGATGKIVLHPW